MTLAVVIGFPVAAFAVTGTSMNITDPVTAANKAHVDAKGNLFATLHDSTTGAAAKVDAKNNLYTATRDAVTGVAAKVTAARELTVANSPNTAEAQINPGSIPTSIASSGALIASIHVDTYALSGGGAIQFGLSLDGCSSINATIDAVDPAALGVTTLDYGAGGMLVQSGVTMCVLNTSPGTLSAAVFVFYH